MKKIPQKTKDLAGIIICVLLIPFSVALWATVFKAQHLELFMLTIAVLSCLPLLMHFERKKENTRRLVVIAVMLALSIAGRFIFAPIPGFKPVTAIVIITGIYLGWDAGFLVGSLTPLISNIYFMQGPWTPFQMAIWGIIGLLAGLLYKYLKRSRVLLCLFGAVSGAVFSLFMDVWSTIWYDGFLNLSRYLALLYTSLPFMCIYAISNVVFLFFLCKPIGKRIDRLKTKYGI